ncbi:hypothetical protein BLOT_008327 [Blomia tropicalis]|nr:hypothetical protein BLOT_008327 [Blomia tropicalis]
MEQNFIYTYLLTESYFFTSKSVQMLLTITAYNCVVADNTRSTSNIKKACGIRYYDSTIFIQYMKRIIELNVCRRHLAHDGLY